MAPTAPPDADPPAREYTIHELAQATGTSVRNIRAYRNRKLLPAPERRGRMGIYSEVHASRLRIINELLQRGYTIDNTDELLNAWQAGEGIDRVLGLETALLQPFNREPSERLSLADLRAMFGDALTPANISRAVSLDLLKLDGPDLIAMRPTLIRIGAKIVQLGFPLGTLLDLLAEIRRHLLNVAQGMVRVMEDDLFAGLDVRHASTFELKPVQDTVWQLRELLNQALASEMSWLLDVAIRRNYGNRITGEETPIKPLPRKTGARPTP
ncbi:MAG: MerR family transcriptional regulator [Oceanococcaceae bacterium]